MLTQPDPPAEEPSRTPRVACTCVFAPQAASGWSLDLGSETVVLGRGADVANGHMAADSQVSSRHAELRWSGTDRQHTVHDLESRNGTYLNGQRITRAVVRLHDIIRIGNTVLQISELDERPSVVASPFVGRSPALRAALARVQSYAGSTAPLLISGETGTGKELVGQALHRQSGRSGALCAVNCAALPRELVEAELFGHEKGAYSGAGAARRGLFRAADGGTLFLDEIGELAPEVQAKLLRAIDVSAIRPVGSAAEEPIDVRVITATNRDLLREVANHRFRADLYARLADLVITLEPLRNRVADLEPLWCHFVALLGNGRPLELSGAAAEILALHKWPFNVRELRHVVRHVLHELPDGGLVTVNTLPEELRRGREVPPTDLGTVSSEDAPTASELRSLLERFGGNVREVATFLGKDRKQVYRWLKRFAIEPSAYRSS